MNKIVLFLLNLSIIYCRCPTPEDLHPCSCNIISGDPGIYCFGTNITKIPEILQQLNGTNFVELIIHNTSITTINDNSFGSVTFYEYIHISQNMLLKNIGLNAFKKGPKTLSIIGNEQLSADIIFGLIKNSEYSETLDLQSNAITEIPSFAFKLNNSSVINRLKEINLGNNGIAKIDTNGLTFSSEIEISISLKNKLSNIDYAFNLESRGLIRKLGNNAFYNLNNLEQLNIGYQSLDFLPKNAFDFEMASNKTLHLYLHMNLLNESSFETGIFENTKRPVYLFLKDNNITYLDQKIFEPFLNYDKSNVLNTNDVKVVCDCRMFWLMKNKILYSDRVMSLFCKNSNSYFFDLTAKDFENCQTL